MGTKKQRWKIHLLKSPSNILNTTKTQPPQEFLCPISSTLMPDPVIVSSGHTFERNCVNACNHLFFTPTLPDGSVPDFSTIIPNLALKCTILNWAHQNLPYIPKPVSFITAVNLVKDLMNLQSSGKSEIKNLKRSDFYRIQSRISNSSEELLDVQGFEDGCIEENEVLVKDLMDLQSSGKSEIKNHKRSDFYRKEQNQESESFEDGCIEENGVLVKLKSCHVFEQEEGLVLLRENTRTREDIRASLCTPRILAALKLLIGSKYVSIQVNSVAVLVNLSLERENKVKMVRSGIVPGLIDVLKGGSLEGQDHAAGALFSLALDDQNKTAIGVLGGLPSLLHALRSSSERTRKDSAMALYYLSFVQSNRTKLVKLGAIQSLLGMVKSGYMAGLVLLVLCNLAASMEGRAAMLDGGAVECFVGMLRKGEFDSKSTKESCVAALYGLSQGGLRFKGLAKESGAEVVLKKLEEMGGHPKGKTRKMLEMLEEKDEVEEEVNWEELLNSEDDASQTH